MEDARFFHQQANWCYQLAWQCFDLPIAHKLNVMANQHTARARELSLQEWKRAQRDQHRGGEHEVAGAWMHGTGPATA
jgi:hypothetical protein